ncbi:MAG: rRNA maturation RNase YbeY [Terriglobales bacterium]
MIEKPLPGLSERTLARFADQVRKAVKLRGRVNVLLTSSRELRALNRCFRGKDAATDVLSFPALPQVRHEFAGDIVISADLCASNARRYRHPVAQEIKTLVLHGVLHLAGYDHETDGGQMARKEERLRAQFGLANGLIRRASSSRHRPTTDDRRPTTNRRRAG